MKNKKMSKLGKLGGLATKANKPLNYYKIIGSMGGKAKVRARKKSGENSILASLAKQV